MTDRSDSEKTNSEETPSLAFSDKYSYEHSLNYYHKHQDGLARRLSNWREQTIARSALKLAGDPVSVLDLPCGAGRFLPLLAEHPERQIIAADNSEHMLEVIRQHLPGQILQRVRLLKTTAFAIDLPDNAVECLFSMRLLHHICDPEHRIAMLNEFKRVAAKTLCVSMWVDGNLKARRRLRLQQRREQQGKHGYPNRCVTPRSIIEKEFDECGMQVLGYFDFLPSYSMWRIYVLGIDENVPV